MRQTGVESHLLARTAMPDDPTPESKNTRGKENAWVQVGRYSQLALVLPSATIVGWLLGTGLDHWLHTSWISIVGLLLGSAAGLIEVIRTVQRDTK
jgi:F0F1-type ATP synthase assembly protein I